MTQPWRPPDGWPPEGTVVRRSTGRVLPVRADGRVLLLHGWDPIRPEKPFWFTIGGAPEAGESLRQAAVRELAEEVGIIITPDRLGDPVSRSTVEFSWGGLRLVQEQTFFVVSIDGAVVSFARHEALERATIDRHGWFTAGELEADPDSQVSEIPRLIHELTAAAQPHRQAVPGPERHTRDRRRDAPPGEL